MPAFQFVDSDDPNARSKAKSHITGRAHRRKRLLETESYQSRAGPSLKSGLSSSTSEVLPLEPPIQEQLGQEPTLLRDAEILTALPSSESRLSSDGDTAVTKYSDEQSADLPTSVNTYISRVTSRPQNSF